MWADSWLRHVADLALFTATANTSIVTLNLSLLLNKVGFYQVRIQDADEKTAICDGCRHLSLRDLCYHSHVCLCAAVCAPAMTYSHAFADLCRLRAQIAKLLIIPFVCVVEKVWLGKTFSSAIIASVVTVVLGVAIV